ncbi:MAG: SOS response-associated peptidase [Rikenellaceae bacterium]|nr:SOS response-associated peptidase [Rikenellaceae bacterium]
MCFHNSMNKKAQDLAARYGRKTDVIDAWRDIIEENYHINAFENTPCAIVTPDPSLRVMEWGLIPYWAGRQGAGGGTVCDAVEKAARIRQGTYNARSETVFKLPSYRGLIRRKRCLIPSTGYFEYHHNPDRTKTPYYVFVNGGEIFSMGGLYDTWLDPRTGDKIRTFTLITTPANTLTAEIHNGGKNPRRMPLILDRRDEERWLDHSLDDDSIRQLMATYPETDMEAYPVSPGFIRMDNHDPAVIQRD